MLIIIQILANQGQLNDLLVENKKKLNYDFSKCVLSTCRKYCIEI